MSETYWLSRRPKYTNNEIFRIGLNYVLTKDLKKAQPCLELAAENGNIEAIFILKCMKSTKADVMSYDEDVFNHSRDKRAEKYKLWFSSLFSTSPQEIINLRTNIDQEEPMMLHVLGILHQIWGDQERTIDYYRRAAAKDFAPSMYKLSQLILGSKTKRLAGSEKEAADFLLRAAQLGDDSAITDILEIIFSPYKYPKSWTALFNLKHPTPLRFQVASCFAGRRDKVKRERVISTVQAYNARPDASSWIGEEAIDIYFTYGREFDDHEKYHPSVDVELTESIERTVRVYRQMTSKARQASIQTMLILKALGVVRDIRIVIAKLVYSTRADIEWYVR